MRGKRRDMLLTQINDVYSSQYYQSISTGADVTILLSVSLSTVVPNTLTALVHSRPGHPSGLYTSAP